MCLRGGDLGGGVRLDGHGPWVSEGVDPLQVGDRGQGGGLGGERVRAEAADDLLNERVLGGGGAAAVAEHAAAFPDVGDRVPDDGAGDAGEGGQVDELVEGEGVIRATAAAPDDVGRVDFHAVEFGGAGRGQARTEAVPVVDPVDAAGVGSNEGEAESLVTAACTAIQSAYRLRVL